jgi:hypothetical protein
VSDSPSVDLAAVDLIGLPGPADALQLDDAQPVEVDDDREADLLATEIGEIDAAAEPIGDVELDVDAELVALLDTDDTDDIDGPYEIGGVDDISDNDDLDDFDDFDAPMAGGPRKPLGDGPLSGPGSDRGSASEFASVDDLVSVGAAAVGVIALSAVVLPQSVKKFAHDFRGNLQTEVPQSGTTSEVEDSVMNAGADEAMRLLRNNRSRIRNLASGMVPGAVNVANTTPRRVSTLATPNPRTADVIKTVASTENATQDAPTKPTGLRAELKSVVFGTPFVSTSFKVGPSGATLVETDDLTLSQIETAILGQQTSSRATTFSTNNR